MMRPQTENTTILQHRLTNIPITSDICDHVNILLFKCVSKRRPLYQKGHGRKTIAMVIMFPFTQLPGP